MSTFTDTDLTVLEGLDFAPPCEPNAVHGKCDRPATWAITLRTIACGCTSVPLKCESHLKATLQDQEALRTWRCDMCGTGLGKAFGRDIRSVDRIEAL